MCLFGCQLPLHPIPDGLVLLALPKVVVATLVVLMVDQVKKAYDPEE